MQNFIEILPRSWIYISTRSWDDFAKFLVARIYKNLAKKHLKTLCKIITWKEYGKDP